jgi:hypothetical protein
MQKSDSGIECEGDETEDKANCKRATFLNAQYEDTNR